MKTFIGLIATGALVTTLAVPAFAQEPLPQQQSDPRTQSQPPEPQDPWTRPQERPPIDMPTERDDSASQTRVTGELVRVDNDLMQIVVKAADDTEHTFRYTDDTRVIGAEEQISGLATRAGQLVTVHYTTGAGDTRVAKKVEFEKSKKK